jgi:hypothetical protein
VASLSHPVDAPADIGEGELLIAHDRHGVGAAEWTALDGWTILRKDGRHTVASKVATAADVALAGTASAWTWYSPKCLEGEFSRKSTPCTAPV